jgi:hypothetical protein
MRQLGLRGAQVLTNVAGRELSDPAFARQLVWAVRGAAVASTTGAVIFGRAASSSGSFAKLTAIRLASSLVSRLLTERVHKDFIISASAVMISA